MSFYGNPGEDGFESPSPKNGGSLVPSINLQFAKVVLLTMLVLALMVFYYSPAREWLADTEKVRKAAIGLGVLFLLLGTGVFNWLG